MTEEEWLASQLVDVLLRSLDSLNPTERKGLLFVVAVDHFYPSLPNSLQIIECLEQFADGIASREELDAVYRDSNTGFEGVPFNTFRIRNAESLVPHDRESQIIGSQLVRCIFGNPYRPVALNPSWLTSTVLALANGIYNEKAFDRMPILADALQDAGCDNEEVLNHCRQQGVHVRGCWLIDLLTDRK
jgi:hypothetical protein